MIPNVASVFNGWTVPVQLRVVNRRAEDFEAFEDTLDIESFEAVMQPMPPQKVERKEEGLRAWRWWEAWSTKRLERDAVVQDENGVQFRIQSVQDWGQGGFFHYDMTEQATVAK